MNKNIKLQQKLTKLYGSSFFTFGTKFVEILTTFLRKIILLENCFCTCETDTVFFLSIRRFENIYLIFNLIKFKQDHILSKERNDICHRFACS